MIPFILGLVLILVSIALFFAAVVDVQERGGLIAAGIGSLLLALIAILFSTIVIVGTKEVGIVTAFARPVGVLDNGLHWKAPWEDVTEMDAAVQTDLRDASNQNSCVPTRIAHQIVACTDVTIRWRIRESAAPELFQDYRDFDNVRNSLVTRELATDLNAVLADYDPLLVDSSGNSAAPTLSSLAASVLAQMQAQIGVQVEVLSVFIPVLHFDTSTQARLNALQAQIAQTRIAQQAVKTAQAQANANAELAASVSKDPNVLVSKCFDLLNDAISKGYALPAGFSCWGSSTGVV